MFEAGTLKFKWSNTVKIAKDSGTILGMMALSMLNFWSIIASCLIILGLIHDKF